MERTLTYIVTEAEAGFPISKNLKALGYSSRSLVELKKMPESVLVNDNWVHMNLALQAGDILTIHIREEASSEKIPPVELPLNIVYEDEDLMVVNKPAGMPIHPSMNNYENSLGNALAHYFAKQGKPFIFRCINRLDRDTSGLTIIAKHIVSAGMLSAMVAAKENGGIRREYLAIVKGNITPSEGLIDAPISRKPGSVLEREVNFEQGEHALTHYRVTDTKNRHSLVSLILETGRTHQIRVHMKHLGYPLIGDYLYNPDMQYISRQALHSHRLQFTHPITREPMDFIAPLPEDMQNVATPDSPWAYGLLP